MVNHLLLNVDERAAGRRRQEEHALIGGEHAHTGKGAWQPGRLRGDLGQDRAEVLHIEAIARGQRDMRNTPPVGKFALPLIAA